MAFKEKKTPWVLCILVLTSVLILYTLSDGVTSHTYSPWQQLPVGSGFGDGSLDVIHKQSSNSANGIQNNTEAHFFNRSVGITTTHRRRKPSISTTSQKRILPPRGKLKNGTETGTQVTAKAERYPWYVNESSRHPEEVHHVVFVKARRYDSRTTIFSPEGRLYQVEYAMEAIGHAGTCLGILAKDGIVLAAERRNTNKLLDEVSYSEKIYRLSDDMACSVAGITSDANVLTNELRLIAQRYLLQYQEPIPCEQVVATLCDIKQAYTQFGGKRPFGVSILYIGWDKHYGFQLYQSDPSGNYGGWKATCIGNNSANAVSLLKQEYKEGELALEEALSLSVKVLSKTLDLTKLTPDKVEMATLTRQNGKTVIKVLPDSVVEGYIKVHEAEEAKAEAEKKKEQEKKK